MELLYSIDFDILSCREMIVYIIKLHNHKHKLSIILTVLSDLLFPATHLLFHLTYLYLLLS